MGRVGELRAKLFLWIQGRKVLRVAPSQTMLDILFYVFSAITLGSALAVVLSRNPVNCALAMIAAFLGVACQFVLLEAFFLAVLQVIVYAGAVMVLFLFIIMLIDVDTAKRRKWGVVTIAAGVVSAALLFCGVATLAAMPELSAVKAAAVPAEPPSGDVLAYANAAKSYGYGLFTRYLLPFEVAGFLLLVAMIGVVVLSRRMGDAKLSAGDKPGVGDTDPEPPVPTTAS